MWRPSTATTSLCSTHHPPSSPPTHTHSCPLADKPTDDEVLRHWIYHIESTMQYADEHSAWEGRRGCGRGGGMMMTFFLSTPTNQPTPHFPQPPAPKSSSCST